MTTATNVQLLKPEEARRLLNVSRGWLYRAAREGRIPSIRVGGDDGPLRFVEADLLEHIERARAGWRPSDTGHEALDRVAEG